MAMTIRDIAREAGVSTATVSRVLSAPELVAEATRIKVREAVVRLGYTPNLAAKTLRTLRTDKILVTVAERISRSALRVSSSGSPGPAPTSQTVPGRKSEELGTHGDRKSVV